MNLPHDEPTNPEPLPVTGGDGPNAPETGTATSGTADKPDKENKKKKKKQKPEPTTALGRFWVWSSPIVKVVLVVWLVRTALIDWNDVPTGSMEPTIEVGDRILVNKMAYALQLPLSGPKIGVPFTGMQWDNPLDFLPQLQWGTPARGDIVTFWNPVSGTRMVKRIVAEPGDTIEMRGGVMTINGETATYKDTSPFPPRSTTIYSGNAGANLSSAQARGVAVQDLNETLLDETRTIQHIKERWVNMPVFAVFGNGAINPLTDAGRIAVDPSGRTQLPEEVAVAQQTTFRLLEVRDGVTYLDNQPASYNNYAAAYLEPLAAKPLTLNNGQSLSIDGHILRIDNEPVSQEVFMKALETQFPSRKIDQAEPAGQLYLRMDHLSKVLLTNFGPVTLGDEEYFMVGDNRQNSHDSRFFGTVMRGEITGEAVAIAASFNGRILQLPPDPDWKRWFKGLD